VTKNGSFATITAHQGLTLAGTPMRIARQVPMPPVYVETTVGDGSFASGATMAARPSASAVPPIATVNSRAWPPSQGWATLADLLDNFIGAPERGFVSSILA
jgi:hypothetical protein